MMAAMSVKLEIVCPLLCTTVEDVAEMRDVGAG
jgi:hypothetical protein